MEEQSMRKWAMLFIMLLFASPVSAQVILGEGGGSATTNARMDGLGVSNHQIDDDFNFWINPAQINNYKNVVYGELGTDPCAATGGCGGGLDSGAHNDRVSDAWGGFNVDTQAGTWGFYIGRPTGITGFDYGSPSLVANRFDLFWGTGLDGADVGGYISYASAEEDNTIAGSSGDFDINEFNIGLGATIMGGALEGAVNFGSGSVELNDSAGVTSLPGDMDEDVTTISVLVRHHGEAAGGRLISSAQVSNIDKDTADTTTTSFLVDTTLNSRPNENTLFVAGVGVAYSDTSNGSESTMLAVPVNLGLEHQTFNKVQTRFGVRKSIYSTSETDDGAGTKTDTVFDGAATTSVGLGWMVTDNLVVDAVINQDVLFTGTYLISGVAESLSSKLSATWRFE
jgi:hypothetical protein